MTGSKVEGAATGHFGVVGEGITTAELERGAERVTDHKAEQGATGTIDYSRGRMKGLGHGDAPEGNGQVQKDTAGSGAGGSPR